MYSKELQARIARGNRKHRCGLACLLLLAFVLPSLSVCAETFGGEELKDPTRPVDAAPIVAAQGGPDFNPGLFGTATSLLYSNYKVTFIRAGGTEPVAMINETLVKTGDMIGAAEVISIDAQSVSLRVNGTVQRLATYNETLKTQAAPQ